MSAAFAVLIICKFYRVPLIRVRHTSATKCVAIELNCSGTVKVSAVHPLYGSSKGSFYQSGSNLEESNLKATETSNIPTLEERFISFQRIFSKELYGPRNSEVES